LLLLNDRYLAAPSIAILANRSWKELSAVSNEGHFIRNPFRKGKLPCQTTFKHRRNVGDKHLCATKQRHYTRWVLCLRHLYCAALSCCRSVCRCKHRAQDCANPLTVARIDIHLALVEFTVKEYHR
jgi:hypothetical protein